MDEKVLDLYQKLKKIDAIYYHHQKRNDFSFIQDSIPQIQEFTIWFLESKRLDMEDLAYEMYKQKLLNILKDILTALEEKDYVLMQDATTYGLCKLLEQFAIVQEEKRNDLI